MVLSFTLTRPTFFVRVLRIYICFGRSDEAISSIRTTVSSTGNRGNREIGDRRDVFYHVVLTAFIVAVNVPSVPGFRRVSSPGFQSDGPRERKMWVKILK
jgi:hypothetical protein